MSDDNESPDIDDEREVINPEKNLYAAAESDPAKKVIETEGVEGIKHLDVKNAMEMVYLDDIKKRARKIGDEIQDELRDISVSDDSGLTVPIGVSTKIIELNVLTITYFEGVAFQFLKWGWEADHELIDVIEEELDEDLPLDTSPYEWNKNEKEKFTRTNSNSLRKLFGEKGANLLTSGYGSLCNVNDRRNSYVHSPQQALDLSADPDAYPGRAFFNRDNVNASDEFREELRESAPDETAWEVLVDCLDALDGIEMMVEEHLPLHTDLYERLSDTT